MESNLRLLFPKNKLFRLFLNCMKRGIIFFIKFLEIISLIQTSFWKKLNKLTLGTRDSKSYSRIIPSLVFITIEFFCTSLGKNNTIANITIATNIIVVNITNPPFFRFFLIQSKSCY